MITYKANTGKSTDKILEQISTSYYLLLNEVLDIKWKPNYFISMYKQSGSKNKHFKEEIQITIQQQIKYSVKKSNRICMKEL